MIETREPERTLYDALAVIAPTGIDRGETMITLSKATADGDAEAFAIPEEVFGAGGEPGCSLCDVLSVPAPDGAAAGETERTAQKETVTCDEEALVITKLVRLDG